MDDTIDIAQKATRDVPVFNYDFEVSDTHVNVYKIIHVCENIAAQWFVQLLGAADDTKSYKGRMKLNKRQRRRAVVNAFKDVNVKVFPTEEEIRGKKFYYSDRTPEREWGDDLHPMNNIVIPKAENHWTPMQLQIYEDVKSTERNTFINVLIDKKSIGGKGIDYLSTYLTLRGVSRKITPVDGIEQLIEVINAKFARGIYFIYAPRSVRAEFVDRFFVIVNAVKMGRRPDSIDVLPEKFKQPHIWVILDDMPDKDYEYTTQWKLWEVVYTPEGDSLSEIDVPRV